MSPSHSVRTKALPHPLTTPVAIDIETGEFELAETTLAAAAKMFERLPDAQLWFERIGAEGVHKFHAVRPAY